MGSSGAGEADLEPSAPPEPKNVDPFPMGVCGIGGSVCCDCAVPLVVDDGDGGRLRSGGLELPMVERRRARPRDASVTGAV